MERGFSVLAVLWTQSIYGMLLLLLHAVVGAVGDAPAFSFGFRLLVKRFAYRFRAPFARLSVCTASGSGPLHGLRNVANVVCKTMSDDRPTGAMSPWRHNASNTSQTERMSDRVGG